MLKQHSFRKIELVRKERKQGATCVDFLFGTKCSQYVI